MGSILKKEMPHAVCIPCPAQGHINSMLQFSKLLHHKGFHITFVHTEASYSRILASSGPASLDGLPGFRFEAIPDGMPPDESLTNNENLSCVALALRENMCDPFRKLLNRLNEDPEGPKVTCIVSDTFLSFTLDIAAEFGIPDVSFCSVSACGFLGLFAMKELMERGIVPLKSESDLSNGYLDTAVDCISGMNNMRLRDFPSFIRTTDPDNFLLNFTKEEAQYALRATAMVVHTFDELEAPVLNAMAAILPPVYAIGPLNLMCRQAFDDSLNTIGSSFWKKDTSCLDWLTDKEPRSVIYVNFGSIAVLSRKQLIEFAWGLANSGHNFLWVIRPDLVSEDSANLPEELLSKVGERGLLTNWCPQENVLMHPSIGGFMTHCGWNSFMESICCGIPMLCWPYFADQQPNCHYICNEWGIGLEISNDVSREEVEVLIKKLFGEEKGKEMRKMALKWKQSAIEAAQPNGNSFLNLERVINEVLLLKNE